MTELVDNILEISNLKVYFKKKNKFNILDYFLNSTAQNNTSVLKAVDDISFNLKKGETLGIVGESGCGKSTLGRTIMQLIEPDFGKVIYNNIDLAQLSKQQLRNIRKEIQVVFQDPLASLNPRMTVGQIIAEPLKNFYPALGKQEILNKVFTVMQDVGLLQEHINRYPHEFSGGQCQRIGIARALIVEPKIIVCDEAVSALDVSIQAQIINLLKALQKKYGLSLIFIAHNLSVVRNISDRIMVMYLGKIMELGVADSLYRAPKHPYTKALLAAIPVPDPNYERSKKMLELNGEVPSSDDRLSGCRFKTRCKFATDKCFVTEPLLKNISADGNYPQIVACHYDIG